MWFIQYRHSIRFEEAGVKFVQSEADTVIGSLQLKSDGYVITNIAPTSKVRMGAFLAGTLTDPEEPLLG